MMSFTLFILFSALFYFCNIGDCYPTQQCQIGCTSGPRAMLNATINNGTEFFYPNISACSGLFYGYIGGAEAGAICAPNWHVCNTFDIDLIRSVSWNDQYLDPISTGQCFAFNAAQDFGLCRYCTGNIHEDDMAAFGAGCYLRDEDSCFTPDVENHKLGYCCQAFLTNRGCEGNDYIIAGELNGVVCCADNAQDPCYFGSCPNNCCNNGVCDTSHGTCTCSVGFVNDDCCTKCSALDCQLCLNTTGCGWCTDSNTCTTLSNPVCHNPTSQSPNLIQSVCPNSTPVNVATINVGAAVGGAVGALAALLIAAGLFLYKKYNTKEYEGFWKNYNKMEDASTANPLYQNKNLEFTSALYERK